MNYVKGSLDNLVEDVGKESAKVEKHIKRERKEKSVEERKKQRNDIDDSFLENLVIAKKLNLIFI